MFTQGNLQAVGEQFTVQQVGKRKEIINQIITHHTNFNPDLHKRVHSKATYRLLVEEFTV